MGRNGSKNKGDKAEREAAKFLSEQTGLDVRRQLGAGRKDDVGDLHGMPHIAIQVKDWGDTDAAIREGIRGVLRQQKNRRSRYAVVMLRRYGGRWVFIMEPTNFLRLLRDAIRGRRAMRELGWDDAPHTWEDLVQRRREENVSR